MAASDPNLVTPTNSFQSYVSQQNPSNNGLLPGVSSVQPPTNQTYPGQTGGFVSGQQPTFTPPQTTQSAPTSSFSAYVAEQNQQTPGTTTTPDQTSGTGFSSYVAQQEAAENAPSQAGSFNFDSGNPLLDTSINAVVNAALDTKQTIPQDIYNFAALSIGQATGWCGDYASTLSTASKVGDNWADKIDKVTTQTGIKAGDKIVIPLGVTKNADGSYSGYGHVMVAISDETPDGNVAIAQSNADGRENKGEGPGIASTAIYNVNSLQKQYGSNWGAIQGSLKINPFTADAVSKGAGIEPEPNQTATSSVPSVMTNDQEPPAGMDISNPQNLADYVTQNGVQDLQNKSWWQSQPDDVRAQAWNLITQSQGPMEGPPAPPTGDGSILSQSATPPDSALMSFIKNISSYKGPGSDALNSGELQIESGIGGVGLDIKQFGEQDSGPAAPIIKAVGDSVEQLSNAIDDLRTGNLVGTAVNIGGASPVGVAFNTGMESAGIAPIMKGALQTAQSVISTGLNSIPGIKSLPDDVKGLINTGVMLAGAQVLHDSITDTVGGLKESLGSDIKNAFLNKAALDPATMADLTSKLPPDVQNNVLNFYKNVTKSVGDMVTGKTTPGIPDDIRTQTQNIMQNALAGQSELGVAQESLTGNITTAQGVSFVKWFNNVFTSPEIAPPGFQSILEDGKSAAAGQLDPVQFTKEAAQVIVPKTGDAALREQVSTPPDPITQNQPYLNPQTNLQTTPAQEFAKTSAQLSQAQSQGTIPVPEASVPGIPNSQSSGLIPQPTQPVLDTKAYTYSDGKVGVSTEINLPNKSTIIPMGTTAYPDQISALQAITPQIRAAVGIDPSTEAELVRSKLADLSQNGFQKPKPPEPSEPNQQTDIQGPETENVKNPVDTLKEGQSQSTRKISAQSLNMEANAIRQGLIHEGDWALAEYDTIPDTPQLEQAMHFENNDHAAAFKAVMDNSGFPRGLLPNAVRIALENSPETTVDELQALASDENKTRKSTTFAAQNISILRNQSLDNPVSAISNYERVLLQKAKDRIAANVVRRQSESNQSKLQVKTMAKGTASDIKSTLREEREAVTTRAKTAMKEAKIPKQSYKDWVKSLAC